MPTETACAAAFRRILAVDNKKAGLNPAFS
jgi:hypothetical protein